jgi:hypothetical protein
MAGGELRLGIVSMYTRTWCQPSGISPERKPLLTWQTFEPLYRHENLHQCSLCGEFSGQSFGLATSSRGGNAPHPRDGPGALLSGLPAAMPLSDSG